MAQRLAPKLEALIPCSQTAFIKGRCIHENFVFVKGLVQQFHRQKKATMMLKLDISKAFDTVSWGFLLSMMEFRGFGPNWRPWISAIFLTDKWGTHRPNQASKGTEAGRPFIASPLRVSNGCPSSHGESSETSWFAVTTKCKKAFASHLSVR
jgi:hypothetical protein